MINLTFPDGIYFSYLPRDAEVRNIFVSWKSLMTFLLYVIGVWVVDIPRDRHLEELSKANYITYFWIKRPNKAGSNSNKPLIHFRNILKITIGGEHLKQGILTFLLDQVQASCWQYLFQLLWTQVIHFLRWNNISAAHLKTVQYKWSCKCDHSIKKK